MAALKRLDVVGGPREASFDRLAELARDCFDAPSAISFLDARRWWPKAWSGLRARPLPRAATFCDQVVDGEELIEVPDALADTRFSALPIVQSGPRVRYYAGAPIRDARGYGVGTFCIFGFEPRRLDERERLRLRDFADMTAALCELRASGRSAVAELAILGEATRDAIVVVAADGTIVQANRAAREMFGHDEPRGLAITQLVTDWNEVRKRGANMIEQWAAHRSSRCFPVEISCAESDGHVTAVIRDVSERHAARTAQEAAQERLAFLFRATSDLLEQPLSVDALLETLTRLVLPTLADWCSVDLLDERGGHLRRVVCAPGVSDGAARQLDGSPRLLRGGERSLVAHVLDGGAPVLSHASDGVGGGSCIVVPLNARGRTVGAVTLVALARVYGPDDLQLCLELAHRVALALENARLYDEARRAVRVRDDVLAIVSHDLRNPLSTILTSTERLLTREIDDARPSIERCRRAAQRMTRMITDLVDAASLDSGTLSLDRRPHDVARVLQDAADLLLPLAEARGHTLLLDGEGFLPPALCDRERVVQVLSNLVGNALKFSPTPSTVRISARSTGEMVRLSVSDNGPGIATDLLPYIFERYWHTRLDNRTGAGLGLYISKGIVEGHGGRIWVDANPEGGSTFHFTLPTADIKALHATH